MTDSDPRNEQPEGNDSPLSEQDERLNREPSALSEGSPQAGASEAAAPAASPDGSPEQPASQQPATGQQSAYSRPEWSHTAQPSMPAGDNASWGQHDPEDESLRQRRIKRIIGFAAIFLSVAILLTAGTAAVVYNIVSSRLPAVTSATTSPTTRPTTVPTSPSTTAPGGQTTKPSINATTNATTNVAGNTAGQTQTTNKHFNIVDASAQQDPNKTALSIMEIAKRNKPAVVAITTAAQIQNQLGQTGLVDAAGSGFIITADGYVVTNYHVIEGAQTISVALDDGRIFPAVITGSDSRNDLAVLKINTTGLPTVKLGDSKNLEVGELAVAIGNALGELKGTVTAGIISATDRQVTIENQSLVLLQTDAAINAGNSGGALINSFGEVIGINTAKNAGTGVEGLGFAIPIDIAKPIIQSLIQNGYVSGRPKLGIGTRDVTEQMAQYYNMRQGVYVRTVEANSAAALAGIAVGDVIIKADGKDALTTDVLNTAKESHNVGDTMKITLVRDGKEITVDVVLKEDVPTTAS